MAAQDFCLEKDGKGNKKNTFFGFISGPDLKLGIQYFTAGNTDNSEMY